MHAAAYGAQDFVRITKDKTRRLLLQQVGGSVTPTHRAKIDSCGPRGIRVASFIAHVDRLRTGDPAFPQNAAEFGRLAKQRGAARVKIHPSASASFQDL